MKAVAVFLLLLSCVAVSHAGFRCVQAPRLYNACQLDATVGMVVATTRSNYAFLLIGNVWYRLSYIRIKKVTVGPSGIWGIDKYNRVYRFICGNFRRGRGIPMSMIDAGFKNAVVGISTRYQTQCLKSQHALSFNGYNSLPWYNLGVVLRSISCSIHGPCWGISKSFAVVYMKYANPYNCRFTVWKTVSGRRFKQIDISTVGYVFGVDFSHRVYKRIGISSRFPHGTRWIYVPLCFAIKHVSYDMRNLWAVTKTGLIMKCRI